MTEKDKRQREKAMVSQMIALYCRKKHGGAGLCPDCRALEAYAHQRSDRCPRMAEKRFCSGCPAPCYSPPKREAIRRAMAFSGPRMLLYHPGVTLRHGLEQLKKRRKP